MALKFVVPGRLIPVRHQHDLEQVRRSAGQVGGLAGLGAPDLEALAEAVTAMGTALADGSGGWVSRPPVTPVRPADAGAPPRR